MKEGPSFEINPTAEHTKENHLQNNEGVPVTFERNRSPYEDDHDTMDPERIPEADRLKTKALTPNIETTDIPATPPTVTKKRTVEVIEGTTKPHLEHAFIKYGDGKGTSELETIESSPTHIKLNIFKQERYTEKKYNFIHTHPSDTTNLPISKKLGLIARFSNWIRGHKPEETVDPYPNLLHSALDMRSFLSHDKMKYATIAVRDPKSGVVFGYNVLAKTKESPSSVIAELRQGNIFKAWWKNFKAKRNAKKYNDDMVKHWMNGDQDKIRDSYDDFLAKYKLKSRLVPAAGYKVNDAKISFEKIPE